jgi:hypothetical protein
MIKLVSNNSLCLIGKLKDVELQLASMLDKNMTLAEYIKQQVINHKNTLN